MLQTTNFSLLHWQQYSTQFGPTHGGSAPIGLADLNPGSSPLGNNFTVEVTGNNGCGGFIRLAIGM